MQKAGPATALQATFKCLHCRTGEVSGQEVLCVSEDKGAVLGPAGRAAHACIAREQAGYRYGGRGLGPSNVKGAVLSLHPTAGQGVS